MDLHRSEGTLRAQGSEIDGTRTDVKSTPLPADMLGILCAKVAHLAPPERIDRATITADWTKGEAVVSIFYRSESNETLRHTETHRIQ